MVNQHFNVNKLILSIQKIPPFSVLVNLHFDVINLNLYIKNIPLLVIGKSKFRRYQFESILKNIPLLVIGKSNFRRYQFEAIYQKYTRFSFLVNLHFDVINLNLSIINIPI